ncbi:DUF6961 family protein [Sphingomonas sp. Leaf25]|uniref:DUF6961 family protein n=1 Tax=Sphingomonas sp. Leaf25 TaxID=1735692 RepID=UPI0006F921D5|nr:hypothetical protein [Sphingomonas sp. Leaf25]KQM98744.1 hypothetical protein ASE78_05825 [Sphingomonas sp. Leaf25]
MTAEEERWAEALLALRIHGDRAPDWIAERIAALAMAGDERGVVRFMGMATRLDALRDGTRQ